MFSLGMRGPEPITPNFREAPNLIRKPDDSGWYLYSKQYPGVQYGCSTFDMYIMKYKVPGNARHGCMIPLAQKQYDAISAAYGNDV